VHANYVTLHPQFVFVSVLNMYESEPTVAKAKNVLPIPNYFPLASGTYV
jgi:hypothetical protein